MSPCKCGLEFRHARRSVQRQRTHAVEKTHTFRMAKRTGFAGAAAAIPADLQQDLLKDIEFSRDEASLLGKGTFGAVYRGRLDGQEVAIKCIPFPPTATDWKYLQTETALLK